LPTPQFNRLHRELADRILQLARIEKLSPGDRLSEHRLAKELSVSRTPIRSALAHLREIGVASWAAGEGYALAQSPDAINGSTTQEPDETDSLIAAISRDRLEQGLPEQVSEADLMRRYGISRTALLRVLSKLAEVGLVERNPGYGWRFLAGRNNQGVGVEGYRFRMLIEPAGLLEPKFHIDQRWIDKMRAAHKAAMTAPWLPGASVKFFEMNAAFHEGLAAASGNRFILSGVQQQNRLRRFYNYDWNYGLERVLASSMEHLEILDYLERGDREIASLLLRRHLGGASAVPEPNREADN
jgi:DNA-binding GntR family transcriptional regulator